MKLALEEKFRQEKKNCSDTIAALEKQIRKPKASNEDTTSSEEILKKS